MGRNRKNQSAVSAAALVAAVFLAYAAPVVILVVWIISEIRMRDGTLGQLLPLAPITPLERTRIMAYRHEIGLRKSVINRLHEEGRQANLSTRSDRMFDERSAEGKRLNASIVDQEHSAALAQSQIEELQAQIDDRQSAVSNRISLREGARLGVIAWSVAFLMLFILKADWSVFAKSIAASILAISCSVLIFLRRNSEINKHFTTT